MLRSLSLLSALALGSTALVIAHGPKADAMPYGCFDRTTSQLMKHSAVDLTNPTRSAGLIQAPSQVLLPMLSTWVELGGASPSLCMKASLPQASAT